MDEQTESRLVARFYWPIRVEALGDLAAGLQKGVGAECFVVGSEDPAVYFDVVTYGGELDQAAARRRRDRATELQEVAEVYRRHLGDKPVRRVAQLLDLAPRTAARRVEQAREAGLLPPTTPGKARG